MKPRNYWTRAMALEALKWTIEEKGKLTNEGFQKIYSKRWVIHQGLCTLLDRFWNKNPHAMLDELYPDLYT